MQFCPPAATNCGITGDPCLAKVGYILGDEANEWAQFLTVATPPNLHIFAYPLRHVACGGRCSKYSLTLRSNSSENIPSRNRDCTGCRHPSLPAVVNLETRITCVVERRCQFRMAVLRRPRSLGRRRDTGGRFIFPTPPGPFIIGTGFTFRSKAIRMNSGVVGLEEICPFVCCQLRGPICMIYGAESANISPEEVKADGFSEADSNLV